MFSFNSPYPLYIAFCVICGAVCYWLFGPMGMLYGMLAGMALSVTHLVLQMRDV